MTHKRKLSLLALIAAFCAVYTYVWFLAAHKVESALLVEAQRLQDKDYTIDYGSIHVKGFPFRINIEIDNFYIQTPATDGSTPLAILIQEPLHGSASLFNPTEIHLRSAISQKKRYEDESTEHSKEDHAISVFLIPSQNNGTDPTPADIKKQNTLLTAKSLRATLDLSLDQDKISNAPQTFPEEASTPLDSLHHTLINVHLSDVRSPAFFIPDAEKGKHLTIDDLAFKATFHPKDTFLNTYSLDINSLNFPKPLFLGLPKSIKHLRLNLSVRGEIQRHIPLDQAVLRWYETDGLIDVKEAFVEWGDIKIVGNGTFALDGTLQPLAAFATDIYGLNDIINFLETSGSVSSALSTILKAALQNIQTPLVGISKAEKDNAAGNGKIVYHKISLSTQDNEIILGTIPILKYPPLDWIKIGQQPIEAPTPG